MMSNKDFYKETFSQARSSAEIRWEDMPKEKFSGTRRPRRILVLAAVICILAAFSFAAYASDWFGLRDMEVVDEIVVQNPDGEEIVVEVFTGAISLQGYGQTPEKIASEEWQNFLSHYDIDSVVSVLGNSLSGYEDEYGMYQVYNQEMADKLDEILAKYDLKKHTEMILTLSEEDLCVQVGGDFLGENRAFSAYMYEDGTFKFDGQISLADYGLLDYQFMRCVKGTLTDVVLNIGNSMDYTEWAYETASGVPVALALSSHKALVIADLPDSFVTINVLAGTETPGSDIFSSGALDISDLERFADSFDFSLLSPVKGPVPVEADPAPWEAPENDLFLQAAGVTEEAAQQYYAQFLAYAEADDRQAVAEMLHYPGVVKHWNEVDRSYYLVESTVANAEEFLAYYEELFTESLWMRIRENQYTKEWSDLFTHGGMIGTAGGSIWFAATDEGFQIMTIQNDEECSFR